MKGRQTIFHRVVIGWKKSSLERWSPVTTLERYYKESTPSCGRVYRERPVKRKLKEDDDRQDGGLEVELTKSKEKGTLRGYQAVLCVCFVPLLSDSPHAHTMGE